MPQDSLPQTWRHLLRRGMKRLSRHQYDEAAAALEGALHAAPAPPAGIVQLALGRARTGQGRFAEAELLLQEAHRLLPHHTAPVVALARLVGLHLGRHDEALALLEGVAARGQPSGPVQVVKGELLLELAMVEQAHSAFSAALADPRSQETAGKGLARCHNMLGIAMAEQGLHEPAMFAFRRAAALDPRWSGPCVNMGVALSRIGRQERAVEAFEDALLREPMNPAARLNLGCTYHALGQRQLAAEVLSELLDMAPGYPSARVALANVLGEMRELDQAIALLLEELEECPDQPAAWSSLGLAYICSGSADDGERCLLRALDLAPGYFNAIHNLVNLYVTQGRPQEAERLLEQARQQDPERASRIVGSGLRFEAPEVTS